jgi:hypothetical protein
VKDLHEEEQGTNIEPCCSTVQRSRHLQVLFLNEPMHLVPAPPMQSWSKRGMLQFINWKHTFIHNAEVESIAFVINQCVHVNLRAWPKPSCLDHMPQSSTHDIFHENVQTRGRFVPSMFCWIRCAYNTQSDLVTCSWCPKWTGDPPMAVFFQWHNGKKHAKSRNTSKRKLRTISASSPHSPPEIAHKPLELSESTGQALNQRKTEIWWSQIRFWRTWSGTIPSTCRTGCKLVATVLIVVNIKATQHAFLTCFRAYLFQGSMMFNVPNKSWYSTTYAGFCLPPVPPEAR